MADASEEDRELRGTAKDFEAEEEMPELIMPERKKGTLGWEKVERRRGLLWHTSCTICSVDIRL